jgi:hypothetical protein
MGPPKADLAMTSRLPAYERGMALVLFAVLLGIGALYLIVGELDSLRVRSLQDQRTAAALVQAKEALLAYATTYRDTHADEVPGYLPCPDVDGDGSADALVCGGTDEVVVGLLPFKQLGLADFRDPTGTCFWYVVSGTFKAAAAKPTPLNWDTQGQLAVIDTAGNTVATPEDAQGGAAAAIVAAGSPLTGQVRQNDPAKVCGIADAAAVHTAYLDGGYTFPADAGAIVQLRQGESRSAGNNDRLAWVTPREIFERIKRRADFAGAAGSQLNSLIGELAVALDASRPLPQNAQNLGDKIVGEVPSTISTMMSSTWEKYLDNWRDQFRYVLCAPPGSCLTVNGSACSGALIFTGERPNPGPRTSADKAALATYLDAVNLAAYSDAHGVPPAYPFSGATLVSIADPRSPAPGDALACLP